jgi:hypothetical protein
MHNTLIAVLLCLAFHAGAQATSSVRIKSTNEFEVKADSNLHEWKIASWLTLPQREGAKNYSTKIKILYSVSGIYCLFFCEDQRITSSIKKDFADLYKEDVVEAFFWTDKTFPVYFEYELSPFNYELPIMVPNNKGKFFGWLPWHYEGNRKTKHDVVIQPNNSWTASFFIPYVLLAPLGNVPPVKGSSWRCNFYRIDYDDNNSEWSWQPTKTNFHDYQRFGTVVFD